MSTARFDIWRYADFYRPLVAEADRLTLGEGWTPAIEVPGLAREIGLERLVLKREDLNPTGSHKDRGLAFQVSVEAAARPKPAGLVVSSSGNGAVAAAAYARPARIPVVAFVSPRTESSKLARLAELGAHALLCERAISTAAEVAERLGLPNLRPSTNPHAVEGFQSIAWELLEGIDAVEAVFTFVSSGASFVGLGRALARASEVTDVPWRTALHAVQGAGACPVAAEYDDRQTTPQAGSKLGALGSRKTRRIGEAKRIIRDTSGWGWVVRDDEALASARLLSRYGVETSLEGAASLSAARRAGRELGVRTAAVVLTGRAETKVGRSHGSSRPGTCHTVTDASEALEVLTGLGM